VLDVAESLSTGLFNAGAYDTAAGLPAGGTSVAAAMAAVPEPEVPILAALVACWAVRRAGRAAA